MIRSRKRHKIGIQFLRIVNLLFVALFFVGAAPSPSQAKEIVIVHAENPTISESKKNLKKMLLGKTKKWDNGTKIVLATLSTGATHDKFIKTYAGKTTKQFTNYWRKMVFSGKGKMPKSFNSEKELVAFVSEHKGAVGYIDSATDLSGVKTISIE